MKKTFINLALILIGFVLYFLQANFFSWFTINGIKPNLFVIYILFIGLFGNRSMGIIYGALWGIFLDLLYGTNVGINLAGLVLIGLLAILFNKNFSKDSRIVILLIGAFCTIVYEVLLYVLQGVFFQISVEVIPFLKILALETIYNIFIIIIIYPIMKNVGYEIESEIKGDKILTRYF